MLRKSNWRNAGMKVECLEPSITEQFHENINKKVHFLMQNTQENLRLFDLQTGIKTAVKVMSTQMHTTDGFILFGNKAVAAMVKAIKQLEYKPMPGKKVVEAIDQDSLTLEQKKRFECCKFT